MHQGALVAWSVRSGEGMDSSFRVTCEEARVLEGGRCQGQNRWGGPRAGWDVG